MKALYVALERSFTLRERYREKLREAAAIKKDVLEAEQSVRQIHRLMRQRKSRAGAAA